jgi:hypothetical protein
MYVCYFLCSSCGERHNFCATKWHILPDQLNSFCAPFDGDEFTCSKCNAQQSVIVKNNFSLLRRPRVIRKYQ